MSETTTSTTDDSPIPSAEFERGARAAAEAMRFCFLNENERPLHEDLSTEIPAWDPQTAEAQYLERFAVLTGGAIS